MNWEVAIGENKAILMINWPKQSSSNIYFCSRLTDKVFIALASAAASAVTTAVAVVVEITASAAVSTRVLKSFKGQMASDYSTVSNCQCSYTCNIL